MSKHPLIRVELLESVCVFFTPVASVRLRSAVPGHRRGTPQSAWWSPACPHCWRKCWSTACLHRCKGGKRAEAAWSWRMEGWRDGGAEGRMRTGRRAEGCNHIKYAAQWERTLKTAICTSDPVPEGGGEHWYFTSLSESRHCKWLYNVVSLQQW